MSIIGRIKKTCTRKLRKISLNKYVIYFILSIMAFNFLIITFLNNSTQEKAKLNILIERPKERDYIVEYINEPPNEAINLENDSKQLQFQPMEHLKMAEVVDYIPDVLAFLESDLMVKHGESTKWIIQHIAFTQLEWENAFKKFAFGKRKWWLSKKILIYPGLFEIEMAKNALNGGPVGELIQWSDLLCSLYLLGHRIEIISSINEFNSIENLIEFDLIFTDILGLHKLGEVIILKLKEKFRILDSFGTEPYFNLQVKNLYNGIWGGWGLLDTRHFFTLFPHTSDNSFLGFMIPSINLINVTELDKKKKIAVIYGKQNNYVNFLQENKLLLTTIAQDFEIHTTMDEMIPDVSFTHFNHAILNYSTLLALLRKAKLFIGLGFPFEGPGPFDALSQGCVFLQPKFNTPKDRHNTEFLQEKPTSRSYSSQNPYLEHYAGEPYVFTIDYSDLELVKKTIKKIIQLPPLQPFIPYEFTSTGFLERIAILVDRLVLQNGPNLALNKPVVGAPSEIGHFNIEYLTDGIWSSDSCYKNDLQYKPWIEVNLGQDMFVNKIVIKIFPGWLSVEVKEQFEEIQDFRVTFYNKLGEIKYTHTTQLDRLYLTINEINQNIYLIRIESFDNKSFIICEVEAYDDQYHKNNWPDSNLMEVYMSTAGQSCKDLCYHKKRLCERSFFYLLNSIDKISVISRNEHLVEAHIVDRSILYSAPAILLDNNQSQVILNRDEMLYSCAAHYESAIRICPCIQTHPNQNAVPHTLLLY